jgi:exonuclease SbcC
LVIFNFLSYEGDHAIELEGINLAVLSGQNGAGKSSLIDGVRFALFGYARADLDGMITQGEQACRVEFTFALGNEIYMVSRQRNRKGGGTTLLSFQLLDPAGAIVLDGKTATETQAKIEGVLGMNDELFCTTACANQGNAAAFSQSKPAERKQVLAEILNLEAWERRAERGRQIHRDLTNQTEAGRARLSELLEQANQIEIIAAEIARLLADQRQREEAIAAKESELAEAQEARANILRDQEADRARRADLADVEKRLATLDKAIAEAESRAKGLRQAAASKPKLLAELRLAEEAQTAAQEMEAKRQESIELKHEADLAQQRYDAMVQQHRVAVAAANERITRLRTMHEHEIRAAEDRIVLLTKQAEVLDRVPCTRLPDIGIGEDGAAAVEAIADHFMETPCPLLAQARTASEDLPALKNDLKTLRERQSWAQDEADLKVLVGEQPGAKENAALAEILRRMKALGYDSQAHNELKAKGAGAVKVRDALSGAERAEAQALEVETGLAGRKVERDDLDATRGILAQELGAPRQWDALLAAAGRQIEAVQTALGGFQQSLRILEQQRGGSDLQLRQAKRAKEDAKKLADELSGSERRLLALKILVEACSKAGVPALLIERAVPDLEAAANGVLEVLSDGQMSLRLETLRETQEGRLKETLELMIATQRGERPYESYSGGEAMRVDMAIRIGLSTLLAHRAGARCELLVLDETAAPLDAEGRALFAEGLQRIAGRFGCILVVTHVEEFKDLFPCRIEVTKDEAGSHAEVIAA